MGERRVLIVIDPPEPGRCHDGKGPGSAHICRWYTTTYGNCRLGYGTDGVNQTRPAACIAAESEVANLAKDAEWACENRVQLCDVEGCDAEVTCGWPTGDGYRQTCSRHYLDGLSFMAAPQQPEKRDRVADALAAVLVPEPVEP